MTTAPAPTIPVYREVPLVGPPLERLHLLQSYYFLFDGRKWILNLMVAATCGLATQVIPLAPYILLGGYLLVVIESLVREARDEYPDFTFDRFTDYMSRAVWPFLISLPFLLFLGALYLVTYFCVLFGLAGILNTQDEELIAISLSVGIPGILLGWFVALALTSVISSAMMLRAGLSRKLGEGFRPRPILDFLRRTWMEQIVVFLFISITGMVLSMLGLLVFCVGYYVGMAWSMFAYAHLMSQLYRLYLSRGGQPWPMREPETAPGDRPDPLHIDAPIQPQAEA